MPPSVSTHRRHHRTASLPSSGPPATTPGQPTRVGLHAVAAASAARRCRLSVNINDDRRTLRVKLGGAQPVRPGHFHHIRAPCAYLSPRPTQPPTSTVTTPVDICLSTCSTFLSILWNLTSRYSRFIVVTPNHNFVICLKLLLLSLRHRLQCFDTVDWAAGEKSGLQNYVFACWSWFD